MRILCASMSGAGHAHPMAAVARALAQRGHEVFFTSGATHAGDAARAGATFFELPASRGSPRHALEPHEDAEDMARLLAPAVRALRLDAAVVDLITLGPALAAEMNDVPWATLSIHPLHLPSRALPPFGWGGPPGRGAFRARDAWMRRNNVRDLQRARAGLNRARGRLGLPPVADLDGHVSPHAILVATLPSLELPRPDWPARAHVVGPCLWNAAGPVPDLPAGDAPLVLIAATTAHDQTPMIAASLRALAALGARGIVTTGGAQEVFAPPPGVTVLDSVPHDPVLPRCAAVVTSGGHGIVARALTHGVPLVVVPGHGDQRENGYRVERAGAGLRVMRPQARALTAALRRVLSEERFREAAARMAAEAAALDGPVRVAELTEQLARPQARAH